MRTWTAKEFKHVAGAPQIADDADPRFQEIDTNWRYFKVAEVQEGDVVLSKEDLKEVLGALKTVTGRELPMHPEKTLKAVAILTSFRNKLEGK